jgi:hypothetical protein
MLRPNEAVLDFFAEKNGLRMGLPHGSQGEYVSTEHAKQRQTSASFAVRFNVGITDHYDNTIFLKMTHERVFLEKVNKTRPVFFISFRDDLVF